MLTVKDFVTPDSKPLFLHELLSASSLPLLPLSEDTFLCVPPNLYTRSALHPVGDVTVRSSDKPSSIPFWLMLNVRSNEAVLKLHTPTPSTTQELIENTFHALRVVAHRVNQLTLLAEMNTSKVASLLVVAPDTLTEDPSSAPRSLSSPSSRSDTYSNGRKNVGAVEFVPGQFVCPLVGRLAIPLHERLTAEVAEKLVGSLLHHFALSRPRHFVYAQQDKKVFYLKLRVVTSEEERLLLDEADGADTNASMQRVLGVVDRAVVSSEGVHEENLFPGTRPTRARSVEFDYAVSATHSATDVLTRSRSRSLSSLPLRSEKDSNIDLSTNGIADNEAIDVASVSNSSATIIPRSQVKCSSVVLDVYGVDSPGTEITHHLHEVRLNLCVLCVLCVCLWGVYVCVCPCLCVCVCVCV